MGKHIIFGGSGFIGHHLIESLIDKKSQFINFDLRPAFEHNSNFVKMDVREEIQWEGDFDKDDVIVNLAAVHRTPGHPSNEYFETNILGAERICEFARNNGINTIVFTSSIAIYGTYEAAKSEDTVQMPDIPYGISKLVAEHIHRSWQAEDRTNRRLIVLRPGVVFGKYENGNFTRLINSITARKFAFPGRKDTVKACIYVKDVVEFMNQMVESSGVGVQVFNLTYSPNPTIEEICSKISEIGKIPAPNIIVPSSLMFIASFILHRIFGKTTFHKDRIKKLMISNRIDGTKVNKQYELSYGLDEGLKDWFGEVDFFANRKVF